MSMAFRIREDGDRVGGGPRPVVHLESDFYMDVDDVGALAVAMNLHADGVIDLAGLGINAPNAWGVHAASVMGHVYDVGFPIGIRASFHDERPIRDYAGARTVSETFAGVAETPGEDGTALLRRVLAAADDGAVTIASVGFMHNLVGLLGSGPDEHSDLDGVELARRKVGRVVMMGGAFPSGLEHNLKWIPHQTQAVLDRWPGRIDFVGFETADAAMTALGLNATLGAANPVALAYALWGAETIGRPSWDPLTVYLAAYPDSDLVSWSGPGRVVVHDDGSNEWRDGGGPHRHAVLRVGQDEVGRRLDDVLRRPPLVRAEHAAALRRLAATLTIPEPSPAPAGWVAPRTP